jgi:hypothetical protein
VNIYSSSRASRRENEVVFLFVCSEVGWTSTLEASSGSIDQYSGTKDEFLWPFST